MNFFEVNMKYLCLIFLISFALTSCDNSMKKYDGGDLDAIDAVDTDIVTSDLDDEVSDSDSQQELELLKIVIRRETPEFKKGENLIIQNASLDIETRDAIRDFNHVDTSFSMHKDDTDSLISLISFNFTNDLCTECMKSGPQTKLVLVEGECCIEDEDIIKNINHYLMIPIHTMSWPFEPQNEPHPVGHTSLSFQNYSAGFSGSYFHHGTDIVLLNPEKMYNIYDGRVTEIGYYRTEEVGESPYYFQVVVQTVNGLTIQYHHTDDDSVPEAVYALEGADEILAAGEQVGKIVYWPTPDAFSENFFHHVHLNIMTEKEIKLNALELMFPQVDSTDPEIESIRLIDTARTKTLNLKDVSESFHIVVKAHDFTDSDPWPNPVRKIDVSIKDSEGKTVFTHKGYDFIAMLHKDEKTDVCEYYLCVLDSTGYTYGNYQEREFYIVSTAFDKKGEKTDGIDPSEFEPGDYTLVVTVCDESGNCLEKEKNIGF